MQSFKVKTLIYSVMLTAVMSLMTLAYVKFHPAPPPRSNPAATGQMLDRLETNAPKSALLRKFVDQEKDTLDATQQVEQAVR